MRQNGERRWEGIVVEQRTIWRFRVVWFCWKLWVRLRYALTGNCGCACGHVEPYGFVPEAECPIHDREGWNVARQQTKETSNDAGC